jgi:transcription termination factor Rho
MNQQNKNMGGQKGDISRSDRKDQQSQGGLSDRDRQRLNREHPGDRQADREGSRQQTGGQQQRGQGRRDQQGQQGGGMGQQGGGMGQQDHTGRDREDDT